MTPFIEISFFCRSMFGLWILLLCIVEIIGIVFALGLKCYKYTVPNILSFAVSYFLWQVIFNIYQFKKTNFIAEISIKFGSIPWLLWLVAFVIISFAPILVLILIYRYSRTFVTPFSIKYCADIMTCGICYWRDNGHVIFSNKCMNKLCLKLLNVPLMNGNGFRNAVSDDIMRIEDKYWKFMFRDLQFDGALLHESVAWDVTEIYSKIQELRNDNKELLQLNERLKAYHLKIDDVVRDREILQAKINIHDEMNKLLLYTSAVDAYDDEANNRIFTKWQRDTLLLCMEAEDDFRQNSSKQTMQLAQLLGIQLLYNGKLPEILTEKQKNLFFTTANEAITNAVKHAHAGKLEISFSVTEENIYCIFENDGEIPLNNVQFTGGLANLKVLASEQEADIYTQTGEKFKLTLCFKKT